MAVAVSSELVEAATNGGPAEIERLLVSMWPEAYRLTRGILGEDQGAEDAAQELPSSCTGPLPRCVARPRFACGSIAS